MRRNENGIAVPSSESPLPWRLVKEGRVITADEYAVASLFMKFDGEFITHAANFHERLAEIVLQLVEQGSMGDRALLYNLVQDAAALWAEMREDGE